MTTWALPANGQPLPSVKATTDCCSECGDFISVGTTPGTTRGPN